MRSAILIFVGVLIGIGASYGNATQAQTPAAKLNIVVVCAKCIPDTMPQEPYNTGNILLDQNTGNLWFYPALSAGVKPVLLGTMSTPGLPLSKGGTR